MEEENKQKPTDSQEGLLKDSIPSALKPEHPELSKETIERVSSHDILRNIPKDELIKMRMEAREALGGVSREEVVNLDTAKMNKKVSKLEEEARLRGSQMADQIGKHIDPRNRSVPKSTIVSPIKSGIGPGSPEVQSLIEESIEIPKVTPKPESPLKIQKTKVDPLDEKLANPSLIDKEVKDAIKNKKVSLAQIAIAEQHMRRKREQQDYLKKTRRWQNFILILAIIFVLMGAVIMSYYAFFDNPETVISPDTILERSYIITPDTEHIIDSSEENISKEIISLLQSASGNAGDVTSIFISNDKRGQNAKDIKKIIDKIAPGIPDRLVRNLSGNYMSGVYIGRENNYGFIALEVNSFESSFDSMLDWERMSMNGLYRTLTGSSLNPSGKTLLWKDAFIKNVDVRLLEDQVKDTYIVYSFLDKNTLIITANKDAFIEIVNRYRTPQKVLQ